MVHCGKDGTKLETSLVDAGNYFSKFIAYTHMCPKLIDEVHRSTHSNCVLGNKYFKEETANILKHKLIVALPNHCNLEYIRKFILINLLLVVLLFIYTDNVLI